MLEATATRLAERKRTLEALQRQVQHVEQEIVQLEVEVRVLRRMAGTSEGAP